MAETSVVDSHLNCRGSVNIHIKDLIFIILLNGKQTLSYILPQEMFAAIDKSEKVKLLNCVQLFVTPWTLAYHAPPSMGFSRQEYWSGLPFPSPEDLSDPGIKPNFPTL